MKSRTGFRLNLNTLTDGENPSACDDAGYDTILGAASLRFLQGCGSSIQLPCLPPRSADLDDARLADTLQLAEFAQYFRQNFLVHVDNAHCFLRVLHAAEGEIGNVDFVQAKQRANAADDAGDVLIADQEQEALERRFDVDVVHTQDAQDIVQADHAQNGGGFPGSPQRHT